MNPFFSIIKKYHCETKKIVIFDGDDKIIINNMNDIDFFINNFRDDFAHSFLEILELHMEFDKKNNISFFANGIIKSNIENSILESIFLNDIIMNIYPYMKEVLF